MSDSGRALTAASVKFLLEHKDYRCSMASLTIRERLVVIEDEARADERAKVVAYITEEVRKSSTEPHPVTWPGEIDAILAALAEPKPGLREVK